MEKVKNKVMYQVATDRDYKVGDVLTFGVGYNGQGKRALFESAKEYDFAIREIAVEKARLDTNPKLPSRLRCMFLTETRDAVMTALTQFWTKGRGGKKFQAVAVKLNGKMFIGNGWHNVMGAYSFMDYYKTGVKFWTNAPHENENKEFLFEGTAEVIEILGEYIHDPK